jgi:hypothetical protein
MALDGFRIFGKLLPERVLMVTDTKFLRCLRQPIKCSSRAET